MSRESVILIGQKPPMNYVLACLTAFHEGADTIVIRARGQSISKAVDVAEIVRRKFMPSSFVKEVTIDTEELPLEGGAGVKRASAIVIRLSKK